MVNKFPACKSSSRVLWSASHGITSNRQLPLFFSSVSLRKISLRSAPGQTDLAIGWGNKANTLSAVAFAEKHSLDFVRLEDGFISYLGHPSTDKHRLSLIKDDVGIYYDARSPSRLEQYCLEVSGFGASSLKYGAAEELRAKRLIQTIINNGISKYNHARGNLPAWLDVLDDDCILLVDQTAGDESIVAGMADSTVFQEMLTEALLAHPNKPIIIKTHPDITRSKKKGHFDLCNLPNNVHLLVEDCLLPALMNKVTDVYLVTSQLGFEALLYGKQVHCFGMPFYAGWGLTHDKQVLKRRNVSLSLAQLVYSCLIMYPTYLNPETLKICEAEEVVNWLALQLEGQGVKRTAVDVCYAFGFSLWKRAFVKQFVGRLADSVVFINNAEKLEVLLERSGDKSCSVLLWGRGQAELANKLSRLAEVWFMEDGFLRSVGLGADLRRPSCLVIDRQGMYYDASDSSDVIDILNGVELSHEQRSRAESLVELVTQQAITKYNVGQKHDAKLLLADLQAGAAGREIVVVPGQFENDLSIACSLGSIKTNLSLLQQVRLDYPDAFIVFKEHPDVYSGVRPGALGEQAAAQYADLYLADIDMADLLLCADRVCTLTSFTGFEALLRGKKVSVYGSPFYAGWGLTDDKVELPNRLRSLDLSELIYATLIDYSRYVDWDTGYLTGPEQTVLFLAQQRELAHSENLNSGWFARQFRKLSYFFDSYFR